MFEREQDRRVCFELSAVVIDDALDQFGELVAHRGTQVVMLVVNDGAMCQQGVFEGEVDGLGAGAGEAGDIGLVCILAQPRR